MAEAAGYGAAEACALYRCSVGYLRTTLDRLSQADFGLPTACPGWNVLDLVEHLADAADELASRAGQAVERDGLVTDPVALARSRVAALSRILVPGPGHATDAMVGAALGGAIEFAAHGWDLASASGGPPLPDEHAQAVLELARALVDDEVRASFFGTQVPVSATASAPDRFAAFLGRDVAGVAPV